MLKSKIALLALALFPFISLLAQEPLKTESATHIFWQQQQPLEAKDYQGNVNASPETVFYCDSLDMCTLAYVGLFSVLDVPKKKRDRGKKLEKVYFAPAFEKGPSCTIPNDSLGLAYQQLIFDVYESAARMARKKLKNIEDSLGVGNYGTRYLFYKTVEADVASFRDRVVKGITQDLYIKKREGAYQEWLDIINKSLDLLKDFATKPEDCYRFVKGSPIEEGYIKSETVAGDIWKKD